LRTWRRASIWCGGQWERLVRVRDLTSPSARKDSRRRMAGGEVAVGDGGDVHAYTKKGQQPGRSENKGDRLNQPENFGLGRARQG
jgi:hypothetical protein